MGARPRNLLGTTALSNGGRVALAKIREDSSTLNSFESLATVKAFGEEPPAIPPTYLPPLPSARQGQTRASGQGANGQAFPWFPVYTAKWGLVH